MQKESSGAINHAPAANFLAPLPGIEEEEAPTSTTLSHVNLAPSAMSTCIYGVSLLKMVDQSLAFGMKTLRWAYQ
jgi:hypothetical protein